MGTHFKCQSMIVYFGNTFRRKVCPYFMMDVMFTLLTNPKVLCAYKTIPCHFSAFSNGTIFPFSFNDDSFAIYRFNILMTLSLFYRREYFFEIIKS